MNDPFNPASPAPCLIASICRCASPQEHARRAHESAEESAAYATRRVEQEAAQRIADADKRAADLALRTPDPDHYVIERVQRVGEHLVMQVRYPSCKVCTYEGLKTMVFLDVSEAVALRWRRIDPHFRGKTTEPTQAPSPAARFPGSNDGWIDAVAYAKGKVR